MSADITKYEAACKAVAEAHRVDEVKDIRDKHIAIMIYAQQSKNFELEKQAIEIRLRAERKGGQLLKDLEPIRDPGPGRGSTKKPKEPNPPSVLSKSPDATSKNPKKDPEPPKKPKLSDLGVDKHLSSKMQKLAEMPEAKFEEHIATQKDRIDKKNAREQEREERIRFQEDMRKKRNAQNEQKTIHMVVREYEQSLMSGLDKATFEMQRIMEIVKANKSVVLSPSLISTLNKWRYFLHQLNKIYPFENTYDHNEKDKKVVITLDLEANKEESDDDKENNAK
jgi:hypothetical protein